jgi:hypothetical protein
MKVKRIIPIIVCCIGLALPLYLAIIFSEKQWDSQIYSDVPIAERADDALAFAKKKGLSANYAIFVDYSIPSGTPRLFVWDFKAGKVVRKIHVMHGNGGGSTKQKPVFSNREKSNCSSLGRFEVLKDKHGKKLSRSFKMAGYDSTNNNAFDRGIMVHRSTWVDIWSFKKYIPLHGPSCKGCITVGSSGMNYLEKLIKSEKKNLLLWSYCSKK